MPKLDGTLIGERLMKRIAELEAGDEVAARDIKVLLNDAQRDALDVAWAEQEKLRDGKRAHNEEEKLAMGIKSKREVRIEAFKSALNDAYVAEIVAWDKKLRDAEVRQGRIYFDNLDKLRELAIEPFRLQRLEFFAALDRGDPAVLLGI